MNNILKNILKNNVLRFLSLLSNCKIIQIKKKSLTVFCYHDITDNPSRFSTKYNLFVRPEIFDMQIRIINENFNLINPTELIMGKIPNKSAMITFDDGFKSYFNNAIPILEKYNIPSINFLNMEVIDGGICWAALITYLCDEKEDFIDYLNTSLSQSVYNTPLFLHCSKDLVNNYLNKIGKQSRQKIFEDVLNYCGEFANKKYLHNYSDHPLVFFGNHLYNHYIPLLMTNDELMASYNENSVELAKYPNTCNMFAYPFGGPGTCFSDKQTTILLKNGVRNILTTKAAVNENIIPKVLNRIILSDFNNTKRLITGQIFRYHWWLTKYKQ